MHPIAYLNGRWIEAAQMQIPVYDTGFMMGVTVSEQLRTMRGRPFRLAEHLARLQQGLEITGLSSAVSAAALAPLVEQVVQHNWSLLHNDDDLGITVFVTPGPYPTYRPRATPEPTVGVHSYPLPFALWAEQYQTGQTLAVSPVRQVPADCWPPELKCRSRMHYYLATRQVRQSNPAAVALLLDERGFVTETPIANVVAYFPGEGLVTPRSEAVLHGISLAVLRELAEATAIPFNYCDLTPEELRRADEVMLTSTPYGLLPVCRIDQQPVASGQPGPIFRQLLDAWNRLTEVDLLQQALRFRTREVTP